MSQQLGLFLNPVGHRRAEFQQVCGEQFERLFIADGTEQAADLLAQQAIDLLIIDLDRFDRTIDLAALGALLTQRGAGATLVLCPFAAAGWLSALQAFGAFTYAIGPVMDSDLHEIVAHQLAGAATPAASVEDLRALLRLHGRVQQALDADDDSEAVADQLCKALCSLPGVMHASLYLLKEQGDLQLEAQHAPGGMNVTAVLHRSDRLLQSPLRHAFPGLLAACTGEMALLDAPAKAGEPELALGLLDLGVDMVLGLPLLAGGALCLMFDRARPFSSDELSAFQDLAQVAGFGLRTADLRAENEQLLGRLTHLATTDALTGVANRRHGEHLIEQEIKRSRRYKLPAALIGFNIDRFKAINDQYGHAVGDAVLRYVADVTRAVLRTTDVLARTGGEEFVIIAPHTSAIDALKMAEKVRVTIANTEFAGCDRITVSLGVAQLDEQESGDALMLRVEAALARAKRAGRNCVELAM